jgi:hypothetical protein
LSKRPPVADSGAFDRLRHRSHASAYFVDHFPNGFDLPEEAASASQGFGTVRVSVGLGQAQDAARTALPTLPTGESEALKDAFDHLVYTVLSGETNVESNETGIFTLQAKSGYTLKVEGYVAVGEDAAEGEDGLAATGTSDSFSVSAGNSTNITVALSTIKEGGEGTLNYTLTFPLDARVTSLELTRTSESINLPESDIATGVENTRFVGAGYWFLTAELEDTKGGKAGVMDVVHIYRNFPTTATYDFAPEEFYVTFNGSVSITGASGEDGTARPGNILTADISDSFNTAVGDAEYQWKKDNIAIDGETEENYTVRPEDKGETLTVTVTYDNGSATSVVGVMVPDVSSVTINSVSYQFDGGGVFTGVNVSFTVSDGIGTTTAIVMNGQEQTGYSANVDETNSIVHVLKRGASIDSGTELTVTVTNYDMSDSATFIVLDEKFARPESNPVEYTVQYADETGVAALTIDDTQTWYYVEDTSVLTAVKAIYEPNSPNPTPAKSLNGTAGKTIEWSDEISAAVLDAFVYSVAASSNDDLITLVGEVPSTSDTNNLVIIDLGYSDGTSNTSVPEFYMDDSFTGGGNTRLAVNDGAYLKFEKTSNLDAFAGNLLIRKGGSARENGTSGWGLGQGSSISIVWGGNFAVFPGNRDGTAVPGQSGLAANGGKMFDNWLIGTDGFLTWDGSDGDASGAHIDIIQNNLRLHGAVTLARSLGAPYNIFLDQGSQFTIDVTQNGLSGGQAGWPKGLWNNSLQLFPNSPWVMAIKGVASAGNLPTIGSTTTPASTIIIKKGSNLLLGFMDTAANAITSDTDNDTVLYATGTNSNYTSSGTTGVTDQFVLPSGQTYITTWKTYSP